MSPLFVYQNAKLLFWIGFACTIGAAVAIALGLNIKKRAWEKLKDDPRLYEIRYYYLRDPLWWFGSSLVTLGEVLFIAAYALAPVCLVTPLSALVIILKAAFCRILFYEGVNVVGQTGCFVTVLGSLIIAVHAPKLPRVPLINLITNLSLPPAISLITVLLIAAVFNGVYIKVKQYSKQIMIYVTVCSAWGTLLIIFSKYLGLCIKDSIVSDPSVLNDYKIYLFLITVIVCGIVKQLYLQKSAEMFKINVVESFNYAITTILALLASTTIFEEWDYVVYSDVLEIWLGFVFILNGLFLLHWFSTYSIKWANLKPSVQITDNALMEIGINFE